MRLFAPLLLLAACQKSGGDAPQTTDSDTAPGFVDADADGYGAEEDCDDADPAVFPGAEEICNGEDENCNGFIDEGFSDVDGDDLPDCLDSEDCDGVDNDGDDLVDEDFADVDGDALADCLDSEDCDGVDNDGDGVVDEGYDLDGDGYLPCGDAEPLDCDDGDEAISPGRAEADGNRTDDDCDGLVDEGDWAEGDLVITELMVNPEVVSDPYGEWIELLNVSGRTLYLNGLVLDDGDEGGGHAITTPALMTLEPGAYALLGPSDDRERNGGLEPDYVYEGVSLSNEVDTLMILAGSVVLDEVTWDDGETYPDLSGASMSLDPEYTDIQSNDYGGLWCPGLEPWGVETDLGSPGEANPYCPSLDRDNDGYSPEEGDCNDDDATIGPHTEEVPYDGVDNDCDPTTLEDDLDQDGYQLAFDCDDDNEAINPGVDEICDALDVDEDCNGLADDDDPGVTETTTWYLDTDGDGYGDDDDTVDLCEQPPGYVAVGGDCDDEDTAFNPDAEEDCDDLVDYDCNGLIGPDDEDGDGFLGCTGDCDDTDPALHPYAYEDTTDGVDNDCDGYADGLDPDTATNLTLSDDSTTQLNFSSFTFDFCGTTYSQVYVSSNGRLTFGFSDSGYSESASEFNVDRSVAGLWDDLNPSSGGSLAWIEYDDAVGVYFRSIPEYSSTGANTFSMVLFADGRIMIEHEGVTASDGGVGWSCGSGSLGVSTVDLSSEMDDLPEGSAGIGGGTETAVYQVFTSGMDLDNRTLLFCVNSGTDADGDGWTDECGDPDDSDRLVTP